MRTITPVGDQFYSPFNGVLIKGEESDGKWNIYLEASNELLDQDEEVLLSKALKEAADYYLGHGIISWDHKHKRLHDPQFIIGEPEDVKFTKDNRTLVKGFLYKENKIAQNLWDNIMSNAKRLGASVGGGIIKRVSSLGKSLISKVIWDETAVTHQPVNDGTLGKVSVIPFAEFAKALMAGAGVDTGSFSGGRALIPESLQGAEEEEDVMLFPYDEAKQLFNEIVLKLKLGKAMSFNDVVQHILKKGYDSDTTVALLEFVSSKYPEISISEVK